jgi:hypothetical protein
MASSNQINSEDMIEELAKVNYYVISLINQSGGPDLDLGIANQIAERRRRRLTLADKIAKRFHLTMNNEDIPKDSDLAGLNDLVIILKNAAARVGRELTNSDLRLATKALETVEKRM